MELIYKGLQVTVLGMGVVFLVLFLLSVILRFFESFFYQEDKKEKAPLPISKETGDLSKGRETEDKEQVALIISVIMANVLKENEYICNIRQVN